MKKKKTCSVLEFTIVMSQMKMCQRNCFLIYHKITCHMMLLWFVSSCLYFLETFVVDGEDALLAGNMLFFC